MKISDCHILLVDDEKNLLYMVRDLLKEEGYSAVDTAVSCKEAEKKTGRKSVCTRDSGCDAARWKWFFFFSGAD